MIEIRVPDAVSFKEKVAEAHRLRREGREVVIIIEDICDLCKLYDDEVICDMLDGIPFEEAEWYDFPHMRQKWIENEAKEINESRRN